MLSNFLYAWQCQRMMLDDTIIVWRLSATTHLAAMHCQNPGQCCCFTKANSLTDIKLEHIVALAELASCLFITWCFIARKKETHSMSVSIALSKFVKSLDTIPSAITASAPKTMWKRCWGHCLTTIARPRTKQNPTHADTTALSCTGHGITAGLCPVCHLQVAWAELSKCSHGVYTLYPIFDVKSVFSYSNTLYRSPSNCEWYSHCDRRLSCTTCMSYAQTF